MHQYPFTPELLDALPEELAILYRSLENTLLEEICSRLKAADNLNEVTVQDIKALRSHGISLKEIEKAIQKTTGISEKKLKELMDQVVSRNQEYYTELIDTAHVTQPDHIVDEADINAIVQQTRGEMTSITQSMGFLVDNGRTKLPPSKAYQWALDNAEMQIMSGAVSYNQAISRAVKELADSGIMVDSEGNKGFVQYEPKQPGKRGHRDHIDVAARRAVMTGIKQLCAKYTEQSAEWLKTPHYAVSAHSGARDVGGKNRWSNHKAWQGKVYSTQSKDIYPNIYDVCGLGTVDGLEGANCRHIRSVWVEGVSERTYTDEQLTNIDPPPIEFEGKSYTAYEATQKQREIERTLRKLKRERAGYKAAGLTEEEQAVKIRIQRLNRKYKDFSAAAGLKEQPERTKILY